MIQRQTRLVLRLLWALPCSAVGALLGLLVVFLGGSLRRADHTIEFALAHSHALVPDWAARFRFAGITFGHVIVGQSHEDLAAGQMSLSWQSLRRGSDQANTSMSGGAHGCC
jgi:hypothetical protein